MSRRAKRIISITAGAIGGLILAVVVAALVIVQTQWFRNLVREQIVSAVENATGGKAQVGSFSFSWRHLRAVIHNFTVHGLEPSGAAPLFHANLVQVDLKLLSPLHGWVDIAYLLADTAQANVIVYPDGHTNIPSPKIPSKSNKTGLETIVDLAIGRFDLRNASFTFGDRESKIDASGSNFRAQLTYSALNPSYSGEIDIDPLHLRSGSNSPIDIAVKLPITAHKDQIQLTNAQFTTPESHIVLSGEIHHLVAPEASARLNANVALDELRRVAGLEMPLDLTRGPRNLAADVQASLNSQAIQVQSARVVLGKSELSASGTLKQASGNAGANFNASLDLGQLGGLLRISARPEGIVKLAGTAALDGQNRYSVKGSIEARQVSFRENATRISNVSLASNFAADPNLIALSNLRLDALGGRFAGNAQWEKMTAFRIAGRVSDFDIETMARLFMGRRLGYNGIVSGPLEANGNVNKISEVTASANLAIAPAHGRANEIPVSGRLNADYNGRGDTVTLRPSYVAMPHSRIDLAGQLGRQIDVKLVSHNLADFSPLGRIPVTLGAGGAANVNATVTGSLIAPRINGAVLLTNFAAEGRPFTRFAADVAASPTDVAVTNAAVARGPLQVQLSANIGLTHWQPLPNNALRVDATVRNADVKDVLALADQASLPITGAMTADAHIAGTIGSPTGTVGASALNGTIGGQKYDALTLQANMTPTDITVPALTLTAGAARVSANGAFQHPVNDMKQGSVTARVNANQMQLADFQSLAKTRPGLQGTVTLNGDATASVRAGQFELASLNANLAAHNLAMEGKPLGNLTATANTAGADIHYNVSSDFAGSTIRVNGQSALAGNHETSGTASIANLPISRALALAGEQLPVKGDLTANAQLSGTLADPHATGNLTVVNGNAYDMPFTRLQANVDYSNRAIAIPEFHLQNGAAYINASLDLTHPPNDYSDGDLKLRMESNQIQLASLAPVQQRQPGLAGAVQINADLAARLRKNAAPLFSVLNANLRATGISVNKQNLGDLTASATTRGNAVQFNLASDLAHSKINGSGTMDLAGAYPVNAKVAFDNVTYRALAPLIGSTPPPALDASAAGSITVSGPMTNVDALTGTVELTTLEAHSTASTVLGMQPRIQMSLANQGTIVATVNRGTVTIQNFHVAGRDSNLAVSGSASLSGKRALNLHAAGNVNLQLLEAFSRDVYSSGAVTLNADVTGTTATPNVIGRIDLQKASFNIITMPNGISNATGAIAFTGTEALVQNITGQSGGGNVTISGVVAYGGPQMQFHLQAAGRSIHVEYPPTITSVANASLALNGTPTSSLLTGRVTVTDMELHEGSDIGSVLTSASTPPSASAPTTGPLAGMRLEVRISTAPDAQFRTTLTQNLQASANLTLVGNIDNPGMLGRVTVTEGKVVFFGNKYAINQGTITFSDPNKVNPVLNVDLETTVQGIDVVLGVSGPIDQMKLTYRSDPPLQFQQIVGLLASGSTPTTDPVLAAHSPLAPQQSLEQSGASAVLGEAVANPVSGRLQRLFGITRLSINPEIVGVTNTAQATLTLQQQITPTITFTYIEDVSQSNPEVIRAEWEINPRYSAVAERDINGEVIVDIFYKRRFH